MIGTGGPRLEALVSDHLAGDARLTEKLRREELVPLGGRIRVCLHIESASRDELLGCLEHLMAEAGNARLMTAGLCRTLCDHAMGNYRVLTRAGMLTEMVKIAQKIMNIDRSARKNHFEDKCSYMHPV